MEDGRVNRTLGQRENSRLGEWVWMVGAQLLWERTHRGLGGGVGRSLSDQDQRSRS